MHSVARGNAAEAAVLNGLAQHGYEILMPFGDGRPYDLGVDLDGTLLRVQCKRAWAVGSCMTFNARRTDHGEGPRSYAGLADAFGIYYPPNRGVYLVPVRGLAPKKGSLRLEPTRNNQKRRVRYAADYEIGRWSRRALIGIVHGEQSGAERAAEFA